MSALKVLVFVSGRGSNFTRLYEESLKSNSTSSTSAFKLVGVISDKPQCAAIEFARKNNIKVSIVERAKKEQTKVQFNLELAKAAKQFEPDLIILAGFMRVLTKDFIENFPNKIINIHPSILPSCPGLHAQEQAIKVGVKFSGCTVHVVNELVDAGHIIAQSVVPVCSTDTVEDLSKRILETEHILLPKVVKYIAEGRIKLSNSGVDIDSEISTQNLDNRLFSLA